MTHACGGCVPFDREHTYTLYATQHSLKTMSRTQHICSSNFRPPKILSQRHLPIIMRYDDVARNRSKASYRPSGLWLLPESKPALSSLATSIKKIIHMLMFSKQNKNYRIPYGHNRLKIGIKRTTNFRFVSLGKVLSSSISHCNL